MKLPHCNWHFRLSAHEKLFSAVLRPCVFLVKWKNDDDKHVPRIGSDFFLFTLFRCVLKGLIWTVMVALIHLASIYFNNRLLSFSTPSLTLKVVCEWNIYALYATNHRFKSYLLLAEYITIARFLESLWFSWHFTTIVYWNLKQHFVFLASMLSWSLSPAQSGAIAQEFLRLVFDL